MPSPKFGKDGPFNKKYHRDEVQAECAACKKPFWKKVHASSQSRCTKCQLAHERHMARIRPRRDREFARTMEAKPKAPGAYERRQEELRAERKALEAYNARPMSVCPIFGEAVVDEMQREA